MPGQDVLRITHTLRKRETVFAAIQALRGNSDRAVVEGLLEVMHNPRTAKEAVAAIAALEPCQDAMVHNALATALESSHASVRLAAVQDLRRRRATGYTASLVRLLSEDESWPVRRAALQTLALEPGPERWRILHGATDPHWRVRHALIRVLLRWGEDAARRQEIDERLVRVGKEARVQAVCAYLHYRWTGRPPQAAPSPEDPNQSCPFWDWDAAVLARNLERLGESGRRQALDVMPFLLQNQDERVRGLAGKTLRDWGQVGPLAQVVSLLDDPRFDGASAVVKLVSELDLDRREELARFLLHLPEATPAQLAWALDQVGPALPPEEELSTLIGLMERAAVQSPRVRAALARLAARWEHPVAVDWLRGLQEDDDLLVQWHTLRGLNRKGGPLLTWIVGDELLRRLLGSEHPELRTEAVTATVRLGGGLDLLEPMASDLDVRVRVRLAESLAGRQDPWARDLTAKLQADPHPHVRAAALTPARAAELIDNPIGETSWHVLATAARMAKVPLWRLEPAEPWRPAPSPPVLSEPLRPRQAAPPQARLLGPNRLALAPIGISGHYGLPVDGFVRAYEAGVNLMFWEPNYSTLTDFFTRLPPANRDAILLLAGTFEADGERVQRDAERVLRMLRVERIALFVLFWVQSWARVTPDVRQALERLKSEGKIASFGLSTHSRLLAVEAMETGWDPVLVRHSAAHRGAEEQVFPRAAELGTSLITFSNTCYGRLLEPLAGMSPPSAADCYRYTLMQTGVRACLSAPATREQLEDNLTALHDPTLPEERRQYLQTFGERLYQEETMFRRLVRLL